MKQQRYAMKISKKKEDYYQKLPKHPLQRKRQNISVYYMDKSFDDFRLMSVDPPQKLDIEESNILSSYFGISSENQSNEVISKMASTHILKSWE